MPGCSSWPVIWASTRNRYLLVGALAQHPLQRDRPADEGLRPARPRPCPPWRRTSSRRSSRSAPWAAPEGLPSAGAGAARLQAPGRPPRVDDREARRPAGTEHAVRGRLQGRPALDAVRTEGRARRGRGVLARRGGRRLPGPARVGGIGERVHQRPGGRREDPGGIAGAGRQVVQVALRGIDRPGVRAPEFPRCDGVGRGLRPLRIEAGEGGSFRRLQFGRAPLGAANPGSSSDSVRSGSVDMATFLGRRGRQERTAPRRWARGRFGDSGSGIGRPSVGTRPGSSPRTTLPGRPSPSRRYYSCRVEDRDPSPSLPR